MAGEPLILSTGADFEKNPAKQLVLENLAEAPSTPVVGQEYFDTAKQQTGIYTSGGWVYYPGSATTINNAMWLQGSLPNTPSRITRLFGQTANAFQPENDIIIESLQVQFYSEHAVHSKIRVRVYRYDKANTTNRLILSTSDTGIAVGYSTIADNTPDETYKQLDSTEPDGIWVEVDDGSGGSADRIREISINIKYKAVI